MQSNPSMLFALPLLCALAPRSAAQDRLPRELPVVLPERADLVRRARLIGSVEPLQEAAIVPRVTGYLSTVEVEVGDVLTRGAAIAGISAPELEDENRKAVARELEARAQVTSAEAGVTDAQAMVLDRQEAVHVKEGAIEQREAELQVCMAEGHVFELEVARKRGLLERGAATAEEVEEAEGRLAVAVARASAARAAIRIAKAEVAAAGARLEAARAGVGTSEAGLAAAEAGVQTAAAEVRRTETLLGFTQLSCPFEQGVVTSRLLHPGAHVLADESVVCRVMDVTTVRVVLAVPERQAAGMRAGLSVVLTFDTEGVSPVQASITRTSGALDIRTRTLRVEVEVPNPERHLLPGMFCRGEVTVSESKGALTLPAGAIRTEKDGQGGRRSFVWILKDGAARRAPVELGLDDGLRVEVLSGLTGSEQVVAGNVGGLTEGDAVKPVGGGGR